MMSTGIKYIQVPKGTPNRSSIALVNLILRHTTTRVTVIQMADHEPDPELFVVTSINWRDPERPLLGQLPKILSYLETMRGTRGVPDKVYLDSSEGLQLYIPTATRASEIPDGSKEAVKFLRTLVNSTCEFIHGTANEVESTFWDIARKRGYSPAIVDRIASATEGFTSISNGHMFNDLLQRYFSIRFRIHTAESTLHLEEMNWQNP